ncbi:MAG: TerB N-terminal domain-containing protein [Clostridia bacterium]|nr:TerB N-terminal domain-containing protein [Clostridia bacterium]
MGDVHELISKVMEQPGISTRVYRDEPILRTAAQMNNYLPEKCRRMRKLAFQGGTRSMTSAEIFYKQGKFMEDYEDDCPYRGTFFRYYPTYESMSDSQLRGYFTWRTQVRQGNVEQTELSFVYVYIYELLNGIGVADALDGYQKLLGFYEKYSKIDMQINRYVELWLRDYVIYYDLDPSLLSRSDDATFDESLSVLMDADVQEDDKLFDALCALSSYQLQRSRFYREQPEATREVLCAVFRALSAYYAKHRRYSLCEAYFGRRFTTPYTMFYSAIFYPQSMSADRTYAVGALTSFTCENGRWSCTRVWGKRGKNTELGAMTRAVDAIMRETFLFPYSLKTNSVPKYLQKIIQDCIDSLRRAQNERAVREVRINLSKLQEIRDAAEITREKLIVDEPEEQEPPPEALPEPSENAAGLDDDERAVLSALLCGESAQTALSGTGKLLSVVAESINEKCFDLFDDTVIAFDGDTPYLIEDYEEELRGLLS